MQALLQRCFFQCVSVQVIVLLKHVEARSSLIPSLTRRSSSSGAGSEYKKCVHANGRVQAVGGRKKRVQTSW